MRTTNNTILITGGNSGIGLAMAKRFYQLGNTVIITGRNTDTLNAVKQTMPDIHTIPCDLTKPSDLDKLVHTIEQQHPKLNVLINNAGIQYNYDFATHPDTLPKVEHEINTNLLAPLKLTSLLLPTLQQNSGSAIVNVSSALGIVPKSSAPVYCGTKAGLHIFTKALRYQLKDTKVFEVMPALVATNMTQGRGKGKMSPEQLVDEFVKGWKKDQYEISIGKVKLLRLLARIAPSFADKLMRDN